MSSPRGGYRSGMSSANGNGRHSPLGLIVMSVGNTRTAFGRYSHGRIERTDRLANTDLDAMAALVGQYLSEQEAAFTAAGMDAPRVAVMASVDDAVATPLAERARREFGAHLLWVEKDLPIPIGRRLDPESIVGQDRLLNAAAAYDGLKQACVVIDAGTAITVDFVDGEGTFHGGAILPGARLQLRALFEHTDLLPEVSFDPPTPGAFGANTVQAMRHGVFYGIRGAVRHLIERYAEFYEAYPHVIATGGDAHVLFDEDELIEHVIDDLTLQGIAITARTAIEEEASD